jgi:hypothetical protein
VADDPSASWLRVAEVDPLQATMNTDVATDHRHEITRHLATTRYAYTSAAAADHGRSDGRQGSGAGAWGCKAQTSRRAYPAAMAHEIVFGKIHVIEWLWKVNRRTESRIAAPARNSTKTSGR